jgi:hypothetical protein
MIREPCGPRPIVDGPRAMDAESLDTTDKAPE